MPIEIEMQDNRWAAVDLPALADIALQAVCADQGLDPDLCDVALLGCDDARIAGLNADFRGKAVPTNVLSWPVADLAAETAGGAPDRPEPDFTGEIALGDIAIAWDTCAREAADAGKPISVHAMHLLVHGLLHLLGYDHIRDLDATVMERREAEILGRLGIDDPYSESEGA